MEKLRVRVAIVITAIWVLSTLASFVVEVGGAPFAGAQAMMALVAGWLFALPAFRRNGNEDDK